MTRKRQEGEDKNGVLEAEEQADSSERTRSLKGIQRSHQTNEVEFKSIKDKKRHGPGGSSKAAAQNTSAGAGNEGTRGVDAAAADEGGVPAAAGMGGITPAACGHPNRQDVAARLVAEEEATG
ncbi:uncharacterized protein LOC144763284 isoform X2 [Lissotriton helveticus]